METIAGKLAHRQLFFGFALLYAHDERTPEKAFCASAIIVNGISKKTGLSQSHDNRLKIDYGGGEDGINPSVFENFDMLENIVTKII